MDLSQLKGQNIDHKRSRKSIQNCYMTLLANVFLLAIQDAKGTKHTGQRRNHYCGDKDRQQFTEEYALYFPDSPSVKIHKQYEQISKKYYFLNTVLNARRRSFYKANGKRKETLAKEIAELLEQRKVLVKKRKSLKYPSRKVESMENAQYWLQSPLAKYWLSMLAQYYDFRSENAEEVLEELCRKYEV